MHPRLLIGGCALILVAQMLVLGSPDDISARVGFDTSASSARTISIQPLSGDPLLESERGTAAAVSYASTTRFNSMPMRDSVAMTILNIDEFYSPQPAQLIVAHGPRGVLPPEHRRVSFPTLPQEPDPNGEFLFGSPRAMAVGDFNPPRTAGLVGLGEDLVVGFSQMGASPLVSTLAIVKDFDSTLFTNSSQTIPANNLVMVPFNCANGTCNPSQVDALTTGDFNGDGWRDIGIVASNTTPADRTYYQDNDTDRPFGEGTWLFLCLRNIPSNPNDMNAAMTFSCAPRGFLADGRTGSFNTDDCDPTDPECKGTLRYPFGQSFPVMPSSSPCRAGYFIAAFTEGSIVRIAEFKGAAPDPTQLRDDGLPAEFATVIEYDYKDDYPLYAQNAIKAVAVDMVNFVGGATSALDLVVQIQPDYSAETQAYSEYDWETQPRVYQQLVVSQNQIGWDGWPNTRLALPIGATTRAWDTVPMLVGEFAYLPTSRGTDEIDIVVPGRVASDMNVPMSWDPNAGFAYTNVGVGAEQQTTRYQTQLIDGAAPIKRAVSGEFLRSTYYLDNGQTPMRADIAIITDPDSSGVRQILFRANTTPVVVSTTSKVDDSTTTILRPQNKALLECLPARLRRAVLKIRQQAGSVKFSEGLSRLRVML